MNNSERTNWNGLWKNREGVLNDERIYKIRLKKPNGSRIS